MMRYTEKVVACALLASASVVAATAQAEPLEPPAGPVEGTGTTQILEIPFTIDEPGSYRLARDVVFPGGINGITIEADNVTLDLGGHSFNGGGGGEGIVLFGNRSNVTIRNGRIADWNAAGIWDGSTADTGVVVEDVTVTDVGLGGVEFNFTQATVRDVVVRTARAGISVAENSRVANSRVIDAESSGITLGEGSVVTGCVVSGAASNGLSAGNNVVIVNTTVRNSGGAGVMTGLGSVVRGCVSSGNGASEAEQADGGGSVNPRTGEPVGAAAHEWSVVTDRDGNERIGMPDAATKEGVGVGPDGFALGRGSVIKDSVAQNNAGDGISTDQGSHIENCIAGQNGESGVQIGFRSTVFKCMIRDNDGDGIVVDFNDNRVDSNTIALNDGSGIVLLGNFNRVVRNDLSVDDIAENSSLNNLPPENDFTNPWSNFVD